MWLFYVTSELTFLETVKKPRYWRKEGPTSAGHALFAYDPSNAERDWMTVFLGIKEQ